MGKKTHFEQIPSAYSGDKVLRRRRRRGILRLISLKIATIFRAR